jgi:hypothetical protein
VLTESLAWGTIGVLYALAFGALTLPKHWYRAAQMLFLVATLMQRQFSGLLHHRTL